VADCVYSSRAPRSTPPWCSAARLWGFSALRSDTWRAWLTRRRSMRPEPPRRKHGARTRRPASPPRFGLRQSTPLSLGHALKAEEDLVLKPHISDVRATRSARKPLSNGTAISHDPLPWPPSDRAPTGRAAQHATALPPEVTVIVPPSRE